MIRKYKFHNPTETYLISFTAVYCIDVSVKQTYFNELAQSIGYCKAEKPNHNQQL